MTPPSRLNGGGGGRPRWSLPRGQVLLRALRSDPTQAYLLQIPPTGAVDAPVFVSVHGISRNAHEQARVFSERCNEQGIVLVAPIFTAEQHPDYQRLGRRGRGVRVDRLLDGCLAEIVSLTGADVTQFYLFGYSGGAQFAHRYVMAHPHRIVRAVVGAAGWYTFPDHTQRYPYGIRPSRRLPNLNFNPERFLRVPIDVLIGREDTGTSNLRRTERLVAQQGANRLERARNWVAAMREAAGMYGLPPATTLIEVDDTDHSFTRFCRRGGLVERVFAPTLHEDDAAAGEQGEVLPAHVRPLKVIESGTPQ